jgi:uncharacterized membrane protein YjjP (DUF1212 family)
VQTLTETSRLSASAALKLVAQVAALLFENGQTTERIAQTVEKLAEALGFSASVFLNWGELTICLDENGARLIEIVPAAPEGVNMRKVAAVTNAIDDFADGRTTLAGVQEILKTIDGTAGVSAARFIIMAAAGAMALGVIFGASHLSTLGLIGLSTVAGALARRWLAHISHNPYVQPLAAALIAGVCGAIAAHLDLYAPQNLIALCPCMVLVPGPHLLNGALDLARARIPLGIARLAYANLIILAICVGLLAGLWLGGTRLSAAAPSSQVPLGYDVAAAGVAVAAYGTFFAMSWQTLPVPILIGMLAHAIRWAAISVVGLNIAIGALVACLVAGTIATLTADRLRVPFAALAFASVVSLIPGVLLFRTAAGLVNLAVLGAKAPTGTLEAIFADASTATLIFIAMAFGLILPRLITEHLRLTGFRWRS